uniref:Thioredoxin domain containing 16 n=1 Tax=Erpetoichthys calabaricus TaxID=27687 RepID=A0A8C4SPG9_ERPCA
IMFLIFFIFFVKVNCTKENITKYCTSEHVLNKVHLFRAGQILQTFVTDTVFDVNAIVAHVLFAVLFNEVKYVHTPGELQSLTKAAKGRTDVVFAHVQALGIPEHRAVMEAAFVYGTRYQFVLSTGGSVLKFLGLVLVMTAGLWFLHCKMVPKRSESCRSTTLKKLMTSLNVYIFLKLMEMPLVVRLYDICFVDILDDEVAESVYRDRSINLESSYVPNLTAQNFTDIISEGSHTVVLFYNTCKYRLSINVTYATDVTLACVNCADWTEVCMSQNTTQFPVVILYSSSEMPQQYFGMLGTESLHRFIRLRRIPSPLILTTENDVESFLSGEIHQSFAAYSSLAVLGLFNSSDKQGTVYLLFRLLLQIITESIAILLKACSVFKDFFSWIIYILIKIVSFLFLLDQVELTLLNLPSYLQCKKPLLILFVNDEEKSKASELSFLMFVFFSLSDRTPVGRAVLEFHLGFLPQLPVLILIQINSGSEVFVFPTEYPLLGSEIKNWLHRVQNGYEEPVGQYEIEWNYFYL